MRLFILLCAASLALLSGCVRPKVGTVTGPDAPALRDEDINRSWLAPTAVGQVRLVPLLSGQRPLRGGVFWTKDGTERTPHGAGCADADALWFCARDRWLVGENRAPGIVNPATGAGRLLAGADLGIPVRLGAPERTIVYLGDSVGEPSPAGCGALRPRASCNDGILVLDPEDRDPEDGFTASAAAVEGPGGTLAGFLPLLVPGVNGEGALPRCRAVPQADLAPCLGAFNVPTGAATVRLRKALLPDSPASGEDEVEAVLLFYGTAVTREEMASWIAVSTDGYHFSRLRERPFSRERFITVAPVPLRAAELAAICAAEPSSPLCDASLDLRGDAVLLFGAGEKYREGRLYLGVLRLDDLAVRYYRLDPATGRQLWVEGEGGATPIIEDANPVTARFGEFAVSRVNADACPAEARDRCADTLVLLASQKGLVRYRTAPLAFPGLRAKDPSLRAWSASRRTSGRGYAPFAFDGFTRVAPGAGGGLELVMYHTLSAWNGREPGSPDRTPYGVFTRRLRLIDEASCGKGEEDEILCGEIPPPWPPAP